MSDRLIDERTQFLWVHSSIDDMINLSPNAMRVYMHLVRRADRNGVAWPSYQKIGDHCFASVSDKPATRKTFARNAIDELIAAGLIRKEERVREDGGQSSNAYILVNPSAPSTGVLLSTGGAYKGMARAYQAPEDNTNEGNPIKKDDDDDRTRTRERGKVIEAYHQNIGIITPLIGEQLNDLVDEVGHISVQAGILAASQQSKRSYSYVQTCARNHANGVEKPPPKQRTPSGGDYPTHRSSNRGYNAVMDYLQDKEKRNELNREGD